MHQIYRCMKYILNLYPQQGHDKPSHFIRKLSDISDYLFNLDWKHIFNILNIYAVRSFGLPML